MLQIPDWLDVLADIRGSDSALVTPRVSLSYGQLHRASVAAALTLEKAGIERGQTVAAQSLNPALHLVLLVALHRLGAACCPLPYEPGRRKAGLETVAFDWLVTDNDEKLSSAKVLDVNLEWLKGLKFNGEGRPGGFAKGSDTSLISISSGTTSPPKPMPFSVVLLEKRILWRSLGGQGTSRGEKTLILAGTGSMNGLLSVLGIWWGGGTAYMGWNAELAPEVIAGERIARLFCSAPLLVKAADAAEAKASDMSSLKQIHAGGDSLSPHLVRRVSKNMCSHIVTDYGTNEAGRIALGTVNPVGYRPEQVGFLCPWAQAEAVDDKDNVLPPGEEGDLRLKSPLMISGYLDNPEINAKRFRKGWFYSGDIGWVRPDGMLVISGRAGDFITVAGQRFNPARLDHGFAGHPKIVEAAGFGMPGKNGPDQIWLALVPRMAMDDAELRTFCAAQFGAHAPRHFLRLNHLPRNEGGKVMRHELVRLAQAVAGSA